MTVFDTPWWLEAAAKDRWELVRFELDSGHAASLPVFRGNRYGFQTITMPPLTRLLGPRFEGKMPSKAETARRLRQRLLDGVIDRLPPHLAFYQVFPPSDDDLLAFHFRGFEIAAHYTFRIEECSAPERLWRSMRDKTRNVIRRAEETFVCESNADVDAFVEFFFSNLRKRGKAPYLGYTPDVYRRVITAATEHDAGALLSARTASGQLVAGIALVWDAETMYYLLSTRDPDLAEAGAVSLLLWRALQMAGEKRVAFDFDGFPSANAGRFCAQFGGDLVTRWAVTKAPPLLRSFRELSDSFNASRKRNEPPLTAALALAVDAVTLP
jgi:hypothetical protein